MEVGEIMLTVCSERDYQPFVIIGLSFNIFVVAPLITSNVIIIC